MITIEAEKCAGCGGCVSICPESALALEAGKAVVDAARCTGCGECITACPNEAIWEGEGEVVGEPALARQIESRPAQRVLVSHPVSRLAWTAPILTFLGREVLPRAIDGFIDILDHRLSNRTVTYTNVKPGNGGGKRQVRRRQRGRFS